MVVFVICRAFLCLFMGVVLRCCFSFSFASFVDVFCFVAPCSMSSFFLFVLRVCFFCLCVLFCVCLLVVFLRVCVLVVCASCCCYCS